MPLEKGPAARRPGMPARPTGTSLRLRIPDLASDWQIAAPVVVAPKKEPPPVIPRPPVKPPAVVDDPIARARAKLSEKRDTDRHQQVTTMITGMRNRRRRLLDRMWIGSIGLTALSVVALGVELLHELHDANPAVETATFDVDAPIPDEVPRGRDTREIQQVSGTIARTWSNELPEENAVKQALHTTEGDASPPGAWLPGTITDSDSEAQQSGVTHASSESRAP
jgi:hypothetical protein